MSWPERKAKMAQAKADVADAAVAVCNVLRGEARGGLGYYEPADLLADLIEEELLPRAQWEYPARVIERVASAVSPGTK